MQVEITFAYYYAVYSAVRFFIQLLRVAWFFTCQTCELLDPVRCAMPVCADRLPGADDLEGALREGRIDVCVFVEMTASGSLTASRG